MSPETASVDYVPVRVHSSRATLLPMPSGLPSFAETLRANGAQIQRRKVRVLQVNIGKKCDLACSHCHVEAGPKRTENMTAETVERLLELAAGAPETDTVDVTGGAPELNPNFRRFAREARRMGKIVYDRCNLTVFFEPEQEDTPEFLAEHGVTVVASLPCYSPENVDEQRGRGVFDKSIAALQRLNKLGYGRDGSGLELHLVYNPVGAHLPPQQQALEDDYRARLRDSLQVNFNRLFTITNMPIKRYAHFLRRENLLDDYMRLLLDNFNPTAAEGVMCADMVSVGWDGQLYDCDFNQMLEIPLNGRRRTVWDINGLDEIPRGVALDNHCYGCTAGAGSSCGGALVD